MRCDDKKESVKIYVFVVKEKVKKKRKRKEKKEKSIIKNRMGFVKIRIRKIQGERGKKCMD